MKPFFVALFFCAFAVSNARGEVTQDSRTIDLGFFAEDVFRDRLVKIQTPKPGHTLALFLAQDHCPPCHAHAEALLCAKKKRGETLEVFALRAGGDLAELRSEWRLLKGIPLLDPPATALSRFRPFEGTPTTFVFKGGERKASVRLGAIDCAEASTW